MKKFDKVTTNDHSDDENLTRRIAYGDTPRIAPKGKKEDENLQFLKEKSDQNRLLSFALTTKEGHKLYKGEHPFTKKFRFTKDILGIPMRFGCYRHALESHIKECYKGSLLQTNFTNKVTLDYLKRAPKSDKNLYIFEWTPNDSSMVGGFEMESGAFDISTLEIGLLEEESSLLKFDHLSSFFQTLKYKGYIPLQFGHPLDPLTRLCFGGVSFGVFLYLLLFWLKSAETQFLDLIFLLLCYIFGLAFTTLLPDYLFRKHKRMYRESRKIFMKNLVKKWNREYYDSGVRIKISKNCSWLELRFKPGLQNFEIKQSIKNANEKILKNIRRRMGPFLILSGFSHRLDHPGMIEDQSRVEMFKDNLRKWKLDYQQECLYYYKMKDLHHWHFENTGDREI